MVILGVEPSVLQGVKMHAGRIPIFPATRRTMKYVNLPFVSDNSNALIYSMIVT